jgi:hypothetical protein
MSANSSPSSYSVRTFGNLMEQTITFFNKRYRLIEFPPPRGYSPTAALRILKGRLIQLWESPLPLNDPIWVYVPEVKIPT